MQFAHNTKKWAAKHPEGKLARALPESWPLQLDDVDYIDEALCDVPEVLPPTLGCLCICMVQVCKDRDEDLLGGEALWDMPDALLGCRCWGGWGGAEPKP